LGNFSEGRWRIAEKFRQFYIAMTSMIVEVLVSSAHGAGRPDPDIEGVA
jgi:hypothetical protein